MKKTSVILTLHYSKLLKCELELTPSILDALANLNIHKDIKRAVRDSLITTIKTSPIEYLPNIVKYLLCTCESDTSDEVGETFDHCNQKMRYEM